MYVEKIGYVIMNSAEMNFLSDSSFEFCEEIEDALIFDSIEEAKECITLRLSENSYKDSYEIINYKRTIWLDKLGMEDEIYHQSSQITIEDSIEKSFPL